MQNASLWLRFWKGTGWLLFFTKFFIFSVLATLFWFLISIPYGKFLCEKTVQFERRSIPIMDASYTDERGITLKLTMARAVNEVAPLPKSGNVSLSIYPNTLHYNLIPFLALIFATPVRSRKHFLAFIVGGLALMSLSHFLHMHLNIQSYYYAQQTWEINPTIPTHQWFVWKKRLLQMMQGFMEQAGSMIAPLVLWMVYAQSWLFRKLRSSSHNNTELRLDAHR